MVAQLPPIWKSVVSEYDVLAIFSGCAPVLAILMVQVALLLPCRMLPKLMLEGVCGSVGYPYFPSQRLMWGSLACVKLRPLEHKRKLINHSPKPLVGLRVYLPT